MSIAYDATAASALATSSPITWTHTCAGANGMLVVAIHAYGYNKTPTCSAVTYNGASMNNVLTVAANTGNYKINLTVWLLPAPATGSAYTVSATVSNISWAFGTSVSYSGCSQVTTADNTNYATFTTTGSHSINVTTIADNCWVVCPVITADGSYADVLTALQTSRQNLQNGSSLPSAGLEDTNGPKTPAGIKSVGWSNTHTPQIGIVGGVSIAPYVAASGASDVNLICFDRGVDQGFDRGMR
jgi:hypothetical protein